ncbi:hypothetical protein VTI74DRAFT_8080 [Chaetomium olivicolor]
MESSDAAYSSSYEGAPSPVSPARSLTASTAPKRPRGREASIYDAVAGRVTLNNTLLDSSTNPAVKTTRRLTTTSSRYNSRDAKLTPEEALFRRKSAPVRYAEHDIYWASEDLPPGTRMLPDSGLLKAIHGYTSRFYQAAAARLGPQCVIGSRVVDERSMDETALLALGVLLEEAGREALGRRGDLVFIEAEREPNGVVKMEKIGECAGTAVAQGSGGVEAEVEARSGRKSKRRRMVKGEE